jgi:hypothetical protein
MSKHANLGIRAMVTPGRPVRAGGVWVLPLLFSE